MGYGGECGGREEIPGGRLGPCAGRSTEGRVARTREAREGRSRLVIPDPRPFTLQSAPAQTRTQMSHCWH